MKKKLSKKVACLALSSAMALTNVGTTLPVSLVKIASAEEVADILQNTFTADKLTKVNVGGAEGSSCEMKDGKWSIQLKHDKENRYPQRNK